MIEATRRCRHRQPGQSWRRTRLLEYYWQRMRSILKCTGSCPQRQAAAQPDVCTFERIRQSRSSSSSSCCLGRSCRIVPEIVGLSRVGDQIEELAVGPIDEMRQFPMFSTNHGHEIRLLQDSIAPVFGKTTSHGIHASPFKAGNSDSASIVGATSTPASSRRAGPMSIC